MQYTFVCSGQCLYCEWLKHSQPPTPQVIQPIMNISHLHILSVCVSQQGRICEPIKICMYTSCKSCTIVGELASSPVRVNNVHHIPKGTITWEHFYNTLKKKQKKFWNIIFKMTFISTRDTTIQSFQYKILHRTLPCKDWLKNIKIKPESQFRH